MKKIHFTLINYAHGGANCSGRTGLQAEWDLDGLVEILQNGTRWPDHLTVLEAEQWDRQGGTLMYAAADKLRQASGGLAVHAAAEQPHAQPRPDRAVRDRQRESDRHQGMA